MTIRVCTFTGWVTVGPAPVAAVTFTLVRAGKIHTLSSDAADVLLGALANVCRAEGRGSAGAGNLTAKAFRHGVHSKSLTDALQSPMLHHVFVAVMTAAFITSFYVDTQSSAVAARL